MQMERRDMYQDKLELLGGFDPYKTVKSEWQDDVDLWPSISHIHLRMYLLHPASHTRRLAQLQEHGLLFVSG